MIRRRMLRGVAAIAAVVMAGAVLLVPSAASAAVVTTIAFETAGPVSVNFGDDWYLRLSVTSTYEEGPTLRLLPADGTVDVYVSGIGGTFAAGLPIEPDGLVYVAQPLNQPLLPAGEYEFSAIYNPAPGGYYGTSQTATPLKFTVTALSVNPKVEVVNDAAVSERPVITASLSGSYVDEREGAPAGTWRFVVTSADDQPVFDEEFAQAEGSTEPLRVEIDSKLAKGASYTVVSSFTPVDELVGGITLGETPDAVFETPGGTFGEAVTANVAVPLWVGILLLVLLMGAAAAAIVVAVKLNGRAPVAATAGAAAPVTPQRVPGDPQNVEFVSLNDIGLPDPETIPELLPEGATQKLPVSTTWLLSDVEPATSLPEFSDAPTERLDAVTAAELPTEIIDPQSTETPAVEDGAEPEK